ncbi:biosynthesis of aminoglycoside antibiotics [Janthinobacterium sp. CG23_2]|nr:biosynthesis of aminoglycoside antibiotics [Janthinobacterium sp. CG23_2]CUU33598.1 biosynthesis of aminoglycoside antibiotics [Janthinobacterium sp. CG23_2]
MSNIQKLRLDHINILAGTQSRAGTNDDTVKEYKEALQQGAEFPPVVVFSDGSESGRWLADGFHRYLAHDKAGLSEITCDVRIGTLRDAKLFSNGANGTHGLPRTNADKNRAVMNMLADDEWKTWSQEQIAKACRVSTGLVSKIIGKASLHGEEMKPATRTVTRNGVTYEQNTTNIGKQPAAIPTLSTSPISTNAVVSTVVSCDSENTDAPDFGAGTFPVAAPAAQLTVDDIGDDAADFDLPPASE